MGTRTLLDRVMDLEYEISLLKEKVIPGVIVEDSAPIKVVERIPLKRPKPERVHIDFVPKGNWKKK